MLRAQSLCVLELSALKSGTDTDQV